MKAKQIGSQENKYTAFELLTVLLFTGPSIFALLYMLTGERLKEEFNVFNLVILAGLSCYLILTNWKKANFSFPLLIIGSFFVIYFIRIAYDNLIVSFNLIPFLKYSGRFFGNVVLPFIALLLVSKINVLKVSQFMVIILTTFFIVHLCLHALGPKVNFITFGARAQNSGLLLILSVALFYKKGSYWYLLGVFLGVFFLIFYARKAPAVGASIILMYFLTLMVKHKSLLKVFLILLTGTLAYMAIYKNLFNVPTSSLLVERGLNFLFNEDASTYIRFQALSLAISQFFSSPFFGDSMWIKNFSPNYPHNIYVESLMAVGIVGSSLLFYFVIHTLIITLGHLGRGRFLIISILFLYFFIQSLFNGGLYWVYTLWTSCALVLTLSDKGKIKAAGA